MAAKDVAKAKMAGGIAGAVAALVAFLITSNTIQLPWGSNSIERQIEKFAIDTNKRLPMQIDEITRWDRVEPGSGKTYSYIYTVSKDLTDEQKRALTDTITRRALETPDMQTTFNAGVTVWYKYYDGSAKTFLEFPVKK